MRRKNHWWTHHCKSFESEVPLVAKVIRGLNFTHDDDILNAYTETTISIVARFYGEECVSAAL